MSNGITITGLLLLTAVITFSGINQEAFAMSIEDKLLLNQGLAEITSHIDASKILFEKDEYSMVMNHLGHPIEEVYDTLPLSSIADKIFVDKLELILFILKNTNVDINSDDYYSQISLIEKILDEGKKIVHDSEINDPSIELQTALYLLDLAKAEYSEGLSDGGTIEDNIKVQDADAFIKTLELILQNFEILHQKGKFFEKDFSDVIIKLENSEPSIDVEVLIDKIILEINQIEISQIDSEIMPEINYQEIPEWIKNTALWWATGEVNDEEFLQAIEYLINQGTIVVSNK